MLGFLKQKKTVLKTLGQRGEELAQEEYKKQGYKIVASNFFNKKGLRLGEIDFIAADNKKIVFVEVKTRKLVVGKFGTGAEAVNVFKQIKILKAVKYFLQKHSEYGKLQPQIDVAVVNLSDIDTAPESVIIIANAVEDWD